MQYIDVWYFYLVTFSVFLRGLFLLDASECKHLQMQNSNYWLRDGKALWKHVGMRWVRGDYLDFSIIITPHPCNHGTVKSRSW